MTEQEPEVHSEELRLARIFFVLPEPISLPDGYQVVMAAGEDCSTELLPDDPQVSLIFHQVNTSHGRTTAAMEAKWKAVSQAAGLPLTSEDPMSLELEIEWTVVEAVTPWDSPDPIPESDAEHAANWTPRTDAFARCLYAARQVVRAYRQATETPYGLPTYARAISPVLVYSADGVRETAVVDGQPVLLIRPTQSEWDGPSVMVLDHGNLPDPFRGKDFDEDVERRFWHWYSEEARGNPLNLWRERWIEARRAHELLGEEAQAVILANTSCEVMLDAILALLMWEEGLVIEDAVPSFEEGKVLRRISNELAPRLKGNWSTQGGAVGDWYRAAYRLRHRVVHGGYAPTVSEAADALSAAVRLQRFVMDQIAERRTIYYRAALMTVAEEGLRRRGMWSGKIKRFADEVAPTEPNWRNSFTAWYRDLFAALAP
ncbi:hypothetical protein ABTX24_22260 [Nocardioides sp. NPDC127514]|uniref:hypothetical protein n=1 Tax=unclassified Nocardioides TaxID=2615069 RepID=UPI00332D0D10